MYEAFYGFREKPFNLTPDPKFLYLSRKHHEAFAHLEFGLRQRGGFIVVTGEVGTGKTTLCRYFLDRLDDATVSAFILYPALGTTELLRAVVRDLGVESNATTDKELIDAIHAFLLDARLKGKNTVLVIDESQNLSRDVLEQVRLLSNLETNTEKLIQIVLIGQSELNDKLARTDLRQLAQRITARYHLNPLTRREMTQYIRHRLAVAGGIGRVDFTRGALFRIHRFSKGIPRLINLVCDRALLAGYVLEKSEIDAGVVRRAVKELGLSRSAPPRRRALSKLGWAATGLSLSALALVGFLRLSSAGGSGPASSLREGAAALVSGSSDAIAAGAKGALETTVRAEDVAEHFELRLESLSADLSKRASSAVLLERWGIRLNGGLDAIAALEDMPALADRAALQYSELDASLEQLRALDLPAVLDVVHPSRKTAVHVTLTGLEDDEAIVYFAPGDFFRLPVSVLSRYWNGTARLFWRDFDALESSDIPRRLAWAGERLQNLGMLPKDSRHSHDELLAAVKKVQARVLLEADGYLGPETRMALYSLGGGYRVPRLLQP